MVLGITAHERYDLGMEVCRTEYAYEFVSGPLSAVDYQAYAELIHELDSTRIIDEVSADLLCVSSSDYVLLVRATATGRIIGTARLHVLLEPEGCSAMLEDIVVDARHRGRGIGSHMVAVLETRARENGVKRVELISSNARTAAHALYESIGYTREEKTVFGKEL